MEIKITSKEALTVDSRKVIRQKLDAEIRNGTQTSIVNLVNYIIELAHHLKASDIHIDPEAEAVRVRLRIDGVLQDETPIPKFIHAEIVSRIKILANLRTDEHQTAQDGRFRMHLEAGDIDIRVSVVPTYHGENVALRLLTDKNQEFDLDALGFSLRDKAKILRAVKNTYGMILSTGPTGSGKTTTLYTLIKLLNTQSSSIITIEDPIEYSIRGINQIGVNPRTGLTFANGLRAILRQDPNIIMVGEIRDEETAGLAATVNIAIGQRLVRKICELCKEEVAITNLELESFSEVVSKDILGKQTTFYKGRGCGECNGTGYNRRISINEVLVVDSTIRDAINKKATADEMRKEAKKQKIKQRTCPEKIRRIYPY